MMLVTENASIIIFTYSISRLLRRCTVCLDAFHRTHMPLGIAEVLPLLGDVFLGQVDLVLDVELAEGF